MFRYEENVENPRVRFDEPLCHFSGNHCFGNGRDILRFFAHGVVTDCSRTVRLRNIAQLEAVPARAVVHDMPSAVIEQEARVLHAAENVCVVAMRDADCRGVSRPSRIFEKRGRYRRFPVHFP